METSVAEEEQHAMHVSRMTIGDGTEPKIFDRRHQTVLSFFYTQLVIEKIYTVFTCMFVDFVLRALERSSQIISVVAFSSILFS